MKNKTKKQNKQKKIEVFKIYPSEMGYVEFFDAEISKEKKNALKDLVDDNAYSTYALNSSATIERLEDRIKEMKDNLQGEGTEAETLLEEIVRKAKRLGYDELTFNW